MWDGIGDFVAMGGHAPYVWGSYGAFALLLVIETALLARRRQRMWTRLARQARHSARQHQATDSAGSET